MRKYVVAIVLALSLVALFAVTAGPASACPLSPGYWMNHSQWYPNGLTIGGTEYTQTEVASLMKQATRGDMTYAMFSAVVAAQLSVANGGIFDAANGDAQYWAFVHCLGWMNGRVVGVTPPVTADSPAWQGIEHDYWTLVAWWDTNVTD